MRPSKAEILAMLEAHARMPKASGTVADNAVNAWRAAEESVTLRAPAVVKAWPR
jgi:hypothetical protein